MYKTFGFALILCGACSSKPDNVGQRATPPASVPAPVGAKGIDTSSPTGLTSDGTPVPLPAPGNGGQSKVEDTAASGRVGNGPGVSDTVARPIRGAGTSDSAVAPRPKPAQQLKRVRPPEDSVR